MEDAVLPDCGGGESFALMVLGHSMAPEFLEGEIIVIEPDGLAQDRSYVLAWHESEWTFRQLLQSSAGWVLHPLNPADLPGKIKVMFADNELQAEDLLCQVRVPGPKGDD
ncbi:MAG: S24 family peptidase [Rhodoferax sp.]|nr:S24 family peptidase [Rhodoferax sp.]